MFSDGIETQLQVREKRNNIFYCFNGETMI